MEKLSASQLYRLTELTSDSLHFRSRATQDRDQDILEFMQHFHPRAYQSLSFGLHLKRNQNHIFIMGEPGVGRIGMTKAMLKQAALQRNLPPDVVLVSDFSETNKTQYLYFEAGQGHEFKLAVESFITQLKSQLPILFDGHAYQLRSQMLENELAEKQQSMLQPAFDLAEELSIEINQNDNAFVLSAMIEDQRYRLADLKNFDENTQKFFMEAFDQVEEALNKGLSHFPVFAA
ncbi:hypothetical protein [Thiomicrorhabdus sp.]|uniref:hypothetical protein n=1 Tax=Thiomicrorhabdus sp. TaxID=2039724 RepID=UPI0029C796E8|nr:hypothetical protein [Thiomicrorhabdus sp.]